MADVGKLPLIHYITCEKVRNHMEDQKGFVRDLTKGSISKNLWVLALPMILGLL